LVVCYTIYPLDAVSLLMNQNSSIHLKVIPFMQEPYLELTGPSRAIAVSTNLSCVEVSLKVKGATKAENKDLSDLLSPFRNIRCFSFVKLMYLDIF
jgi:hypothetical protein